MNSLDTSPDADEQAPPPMPTAGVDEVSGETHRRPHPVPSAPAAPPIPLLRFDESTIDGEPVLIIWRRARRPHPPTVVDGGGERFRQPNSWPSSRSWDSTAAPLDSLGMQIAISYEVRRLRTAGSRECDRSISKAQVPISSSTRIARATIRAAVRDKAAWWPTS